MPDNRFVVVCGVLVAAAGVGAYWFATRVRMEHAERRDFVKRYRRMVSARGTFGAVGSGADDMTQSESEEEKHAIVKVFFGTESGNAEALAKGLVQALQEHSVPSVLIDPSKWGCLDRYVAHGAAHQGSSIPPRRLFAPTRSEEDDTVGGNVASPIVYVFVTSTTGEGQAPANLLLLQSEMTAAVERYESRVKAQGASGAGPVKATAPITAPFAGVHYAVFGLGDTSYKYFCKCGTTVNTLLRKGGGTEVYKIGFGDAKKKRQEDEFDEWTEQLLVALTNKCGITVSPSAATPPKPQLELRYVGAEPVAATPTTITASGARAPPPPSTATVSPSPFPSPPALMEPSLAFPVPLKITHKAAVTEPRESDGSYVLRLTVCTTYDCHPASSSSSGTGAARASAEPARRTLPYQAGDHFGVLPCNPPHVIMRFANLLNLSDAQLRTPIELCACARSPVRTIWYNTLPECVPLRTALERYVELCGRPRRSALRVLAKYCTVATEREEFLALLRPVPAADADAVAARKARTASLRTTLDYMEAFPSCASAIPLGHLLELLGRVQPRYYSIASDPLSHGDSLDVYVRVVADGLVSQYVSERVEAGDFIFAFVRQSPFHLPSTIAAGRPLIMIGPGTGVAAMVGLSYRREALMWRKANAKYGPCLFYFGAQHRASEFFVEEELTRWASPPTAIEAFDAAHPSSHASLAANRQRPNKRTHLPVSVITDLKLAFSRDQEEKVYVTHLMEQELDTLYAMLTSTVGGGCLVYVSGDAAAMAKEVDRVLAKALQEKGKMSRMAALEFLRTMEQEKRLLKDVY